MYPYLLHSTAAIKTFMLLFSLYHLSAMWRTRKHVGPVVFCNLLLDGNIQNVLVLVQIFEAAPDCIKKKTLWLYEEFMQNSHLLCLQFPQNILCLHVFVCFGSSQFESTARFPSRGAA